MSVSEVVEPALKPPPSGAPRHLRLIGPEELAARRRRRKVRVGAAAVVTFVIALLFAAVGMHVALAQNQFRLDQLDAQAATQQARYQQLRLRVDQLSSPQRIMSTAKGKLGMVPSGPVTFLTPSSATSGTSRNASPGGPAPASAPPGWSTVKPELAANP